MKLLHMYTAGDPLRDATFAYFADPNYFLTDFPTTTCLTCINPPFAWNHGDIQPEIANTWLGFVGPGIRHLGETGAVWTDHTDVHPTMTALLGLTDDYQVDGRVVTQIMTDAAIPKGLSVHQPQLEALGAAYKQLTAPFGSVGMDSLRFSTAAINTGSSSDDTAYAAAQVKLGDWLARRDDIAGRISDLLTTLATGGHPVGVSKIRDLTNEANAFIAEVHAAAP